MSFFICLFYLFFLGPYGKITCSSILPTDIVITTQSPPLTIAPTKLVTVDPKATLYATLNVNNDNSGVSAEAKKVNVLNNVKLALG